MRLRQCDARFLLDQRERVNGEAAALTVRSHASGVGEAGVALVDRAQKHGLQVLRVHYLGRPRVEGFCEGFLLQLGMFVGEGIYLNKQAAQISDNALAEYRKAVPGTKNVSVDKLPRIIKGQLNQLKTGSVDKLEFLDLLGEAGNQFNASPYKSSLTFNSINYSEQRGELMLEMHAKSFEQLEALKKAIVDSGMNAKISSAVQEKDYFKGRISIGGA